MRNVKMIISVVVMVLGAWESGAIAYGELAGTWTTLDHPSADVDQIRAYGIDGDNIVGSYYESPPGRYRSFLYNETSNWTTIDDYVMGRTEARGVDDGKVVGVYSSGHTGFLYDRGSWTNIQVPGAVETTALDIDGDNIVGTYQEESGKKHGYIYDGTNWTAIDMPGAGDVYPSGIDGDNIVGYDADGHGFLYDGTNWTTLDMPGAEYTEAHGIDGDNIVGSYKQAGRWHGFLYDGTNWSTFDMPGASDTYATDIDGDNIVGFYDASFIITDFHGFVYTIPEPATLLLLGLGAVILRKRR